ncbi:hypothetical protein SmJEL517_g05173 [Synchytrium microbalum]|uniref:Glutaredoxin domain-containing protein n=1 Tax=Synchytrium microbalum TaxID=1806994 RepID=A0A507BQR0_9FUNG|nr:uncharacterized protein SmJEL517_g05173 [Synchytrium microbalum]TPX31527.1 hypothetical protein SmJEL517_g05173 [Synchytrium microbalum]
MSIVSWIFGRRLPTISTTHMAGIKTLVDSQIHDNAVQMYSKSYCPYCKKAKALLDSMNIKYSVLELDQIENGSEIQRYLKEKTSQTTVPNIFIHEQHIGGSDDLHAAKANGRLEKLLKL